jgi:hypothetical protein
VAIDKRKLLERFIAPLNPYDISLSQLLSVVCGPPGMPGAWRPSVLRIVAESRGKREDKELQEEYQSFHQSGLWNYGAQAVQKRQASTVRRVFPSKIDFGRKSWGIAGLELADLAAYPVGRAVINESWDNPAVQIVAQKLTAFVAFP